MGGLFVATVVVAIGSSSKGAELVHIEKQIKSAKTFEKELMEDLAEGTSLTKVATLAEESEMIKPENIIYISSESLGIETSKTVAQLP